MLEWVAVPFSRGFPTQGLNPGFPHCRQILFHLSHQGSPRILEWVPIPSPADLSDAEIELGSPALQADASWFRDTENNRNIANHVVGQMELDRKMEGGRSTRECLLGGWRF